MLTYSKLSGALDNVRLLGHELRRSSASFTLPNVDAPDARTDYDVDYCVTHVYLSGGL